MTVVHPLFFLGATAVAVLACAVFARFRRATPQAGRYGSIDGLRGYLAFFVFLHHAAITYFFAVNGTWRVPPSNLFTHLGEASVAFFFMITAFLFYGKALDSRGGDIDWQRFFVGRLFRLVPLYAFVVAIVFLLVFVASGGVRVVSFAYLAKCLVQWCLFTIFGDPWINGVNAPMMVSSVTWPLPYEWFFYLSMPLLALTCRVRVGAGWIALGVAGLALAVLRGASPFFALVFACGTAAAIAVRDPRFVRFCATEAASLVVLACLAAAVAGFGTAHAVAPLALLAIAFALVAGGADLFGLLSAKASHLLGELSYSIYLLHGLLLFVTTHWIVGLDAIRTLPPAAYCALVLALVPVLLLAAAATYRWIELPAIGMTPRVAGRLRDLLARRRPMTLVDPLARDMNDPASSL